MTNPLLSKDFPAVIHCEGSLAEDPRACCDFAAARDSVSSPQWRTRDFVFAVRHPDLEDRCCAMCVAWLRRLLGTTI